MDREQNLRFYPWLVWIIIVLMILCWSARELAINYHKVRASLFGAQIDIHYGLSWDVVCFLGGNYHPSEWHCRPDWPYETYLAILTLLLITLLVTWVVLRKKWQLSLRPTLVHFDLKT